MKPIYILSLVFILSCCKHDEKQVCGLESKASFTIHNFHEFWTVKGDIMDLQKHLN